MRSTKNYRGYEHTAAKLEGAKRKLELEIRDGSDPPQKNLGIILSGV